MAGMNIIALTNVTDAALCLFFLVICRCLHTRCASAASLYQVSSQTCKLKLKIPRISVLIMPTAVLPARVKFVISFNWQLVGASIICIALDCA